MPEIKSFWGTLERGLSIVVRGAWQVGGGVVMERALQRAGLYFVRESKLPKVSRKLVVS